MAPLPADPGRWPTQPPRALDAPFSARPDAGVLEATPPLGQPQDAQRFVDSRPIERSEAKYWVPLALLPLLRARIQHFARPDDHGVGDPPAYWCTTIQLDTPRLAFHHARQENALNRFKLRVRCYDLPGRAPVSLEIKRKFGHAIRKSRAGIPFAQWDRDFPRRSATSFETADERSRDCIREFRRIQHRLGARPVVTVGYQREAWIGTGPGYQRVTIDTHLRYRPISGWGDWGEGNPWRPMSGEVLSELELPSYPGAVLELKSEGGLPRWMHELVHRFELRRQAFCKYSLALGSYVRSHPGALR